MAAAAKAASISAISSSLTISMGISAVFSSELVTVGEEEDWVVMACGQRLMRADDRWTTVSDGGGTGGNFVNADGCKILRANVLFLVH